MSSFTNSTTTLDGRRDSGIPATEAIRPAALPRRTFIPATCHPDRPAWVVSETQLCHECEDRRFRAEMFAIGARACGYPITDQAALNMVDTVDSLAVTVPMTAADRRAA